MFIFPFTTFGFLWLGFYRCYATRLGLRGTFLFATIVWALWLVLMTELLSTFQLFSRPYLGGFWILSCMIAFCLCIFSVRDPRALPDTFAIRKKIFIAIKQLSFIDRVLMSMILAIILLDALVALIAPIHKLEPVVSVLIGLHFQMLAGTDFFINLVRWFELVVIVVGVTILTKFCGAKTRGQLIAAMLIGILMTILAWIRIF